MKIELGDSHTFTAEERKGWIGKKGWRNGNCPHWLQMFVDIDTPGLIPGTNIWTNHCFSLSGGISADVLNQSAREFLPNARIEVTNINFHSWKPPIPPHSVSGDIKNGKYTGSGNFWLHEF